jgi:hypothetical protein
MGQYLKNILISIDQFVNTLAGGNPDETISSRSYKLRKKGVYWISNIIDGLLFWQKDHCRESEEKQIK